MEKDNNAITIASLNVRDLGNDTKRREIFNWLRSKHFSIYLLQEVHCLEKNKKNKRPLDHGMGLNKLFLAPFQALRQV